MAFRIVSRTAAGIVSAAIMVSTPAAFGAFVVCTVAAAAAYYLRGRLSMLPAVFTRTSARKVSIPAEIKDSIPAYKGPVEAGQPDWRKTTDVDALRAAFSHYDRLPKELVMQHPRIARSLRNATKNAYDAICGRNAEASRRYMTEVYHLVKSLDVAGFAADAGNYGCIRNQTLAFMGQYVPAAEEQVTRAGMTELFLRESLRRVYRGVIPEVETQLFNDPVYTDKYLECLSRHTPEAGKYLKEKHAREQQILTSSSPGFTTEADRAAFVKRMEEFVNDKKFAEIRNSQAEDGCTVGQIMADALYMLIHKHYLQPGGRMDQVNRLKTVCQKLAS